MFIVPITVYFNSDYISQAEYEQTIELPMNLLTRQLHPLNVVLNGRVSRDMGEKISVPTLNALQVASPKYQHLPQVQTTAYLNNGNQALSILNDADYQVSISTIR